MDIKDSESIFESEATQMYRYDDPNGYKIRCGRAYFVSRKEFNGVRMYSVMVTKKDINGNKVTAFHQVEFKNKNLDCDIPHGTLVRPLRLFEDFYFSRNDTARVYPHFKIIFTDWEIVRTAEGTRRKENYDAISEYNESIGEDDYIF